MMVAFYLLVSMSHYPKKVKKYATGGVAGVGINYVTTAPKIANVEAAQYLSDRLRQADMNHEQERRKLAVDTTKLSEMLGRYPITQGSSKAITNSYQSEVAEYGNQISKNPDYVFTSEGKAHYKRIEGVLSKVPELSNTYKQQMTLLDDSVKAGTADRALLVDGDNKLLYDAATGDVQKIGLSALGAFTKENPQYQAISSNMDYYKALNESADPSALMSAYQLKAGVSFNNVLSKIEQGFAAIGHEGNDFNSNNKSALSQAKQKILSSLDGQDEEALRAAYLEQNDTLKGFDSWKAGIVDRAMRQRLINEDSLPKPTKPGKSNDPLDGFVVPEFLQEEATIGVQEDQGNRGSLGGVKTLGSSSLKPQSTADNKLISDEVYLYYNSSWGPTSSGEDEGKPMKISEHMEYTPRAARLNPVLSGEVYATNFDGTLQKSNNTAKKRALEGLRGAMVFSDVKGKGPIDIDYDSKVIEGLSPEGRPVLYYPSKDSKYAYVVDDVPMMEYSVSMDGKPGTMFRPMSADDSRLYFGRDKTLGQKQKDYYTSSGALNPEGARIALAYLAKMKAKLESDQRQTLSEEQRLNLTEQIHALNNFQQALVKKNPTEQERQFINADLYGIWDEQQTQAVYQSYHKGKLTNQIETE